MPPAKNKKGLSETKKITKTKKTAAQAEILVNAELKNCNFKNEISESTITIKNEAKQKSPFVINLKNPHRELFSDQNNQVNQLLATKPKIQPKIPTKTPKPIITNTKKMGVNFISSNDSLINIPYPKVSSPEKKEASNKKTEPKNTETETEEEIEDIFAPTPQKQLLNLSLPKYWYKKLAVFAVLTILLVLPLQAFTYYQNLQDTRDKILLITNEAIESLKSGQQAAVNLDLAGANLKFNQAKEEFALAQKEINALSVLTSEILKLLPGQSQSVAAGMNLLAAGEIVADTGQILINSGQKFVTSSSIKDYYNSLSEFRLDLNKIITQFNEAEEKIKSIQVSDLPPEHRESFEKVLSYLPTIKEGLIELYDINNTLLKVLGANQWQRYLVIFLNNNELRGGGGFMGSFALLDIDRGEIKKIEIPGGGTYAIQGQLIPKVISPEPLHLINSRWEFQDANWWPDYPATAEKIEWFYQNAGGPSVDGVITITSTFMEKLLEIFGPISMPEYGRDITSANFVEETQKIVELEYDKEENRPKQFIADLAPKLLERVFNANSEEIGKLVDALKQELNEKQFLVYFNDQKTEELIKQFGWAGELRQTEGDYLSVVQSNIAGAKTDRVIKETIEHQAEIQEDGSIINTVKLIRRHTGIKGDNIFTGVQNNSYVRFYVPLGSTLMSAEGFKSPPAELFEKPAPDYQKDLDLISIETEHTKDEKSDTDIYKEKGKTVFGNWLQLKPGEVQETTIKYRLPFKLALEGQNTFYYSLLAQKQLGSIGSEFKSYLRLNDKLQPLAKFPADLPGNESGTIFSAILTTDQFYGVVLINK
ncbi:MAG: DUF4012 domain-containing protein [Patescibacteria group bacterium]|jgi:hypothetical protein